MVIIRSDLIVAIFENKHCDNGRNHRRYSISTRATDTDIYHFFAITGSNNVVVFECDTYDTFNRSTVASDRGTLGQFFRE